MKTSLLFIAVLPFIFSCKKDYTNSDSTVDSVDTSHDENLVKEYFPLTKGSFWIYHGFGVDDSVYVAGDTIIHNDTFTLMNETISSFGSHAGIFRDSGDYIVDQNGIIRFSANDFTDTLFAQMHGSDIYQLTKWTIRIH